MLRTQKMRYRYNCMKLAKIVIDPNFIVLLINQKAIDILGAGKKNMIGNNILLYLPNDIRLFLVLKIKALLERKNNTPTKINLKINKQLNLEVLLIKKKNLQKDSFIQIKMCSEKIRKKKQDKFLINTNISNLSHELRAPLFNIRSFLETLYEYDEHLTSDQRLEFLEIATNETNRLNNLVKNILDFAELEKQKNYVIFQSSMKIIIEDVIQVNKLTAMGKKIILTRTINTNNQKIESNHSSLTRILFNLMNNAIKFTYPKGIISIQTKNLQSQFLNKKKQELVFRTSITDTGIGISKQDNKNIFNRFSRGNKKTHLITGSGLGLPIVKEILSKHDQELTIVSHVRKGSYASFDMNSIE